VTDAGPASRSLIRHPWGQVIAVWLWALAGPLLVAALLVGVFRIDLRTAREWWNGHQYVQAYLEAVFVGLLPLAIAFASGERLRDYGLHRRGVTFSLLLSLAVAATFWVYLFLTTGEWFSHSDLPAVAAPWNVWYALLGIVANGPLEVFFVFWLIRRTDQALRRPSGLSGLLITVVLIGLFHWVSTRSLFNALNVAAVFLLLGLVFRRCRNAIGPMVGWTLINGMSWAYAGLLVR